MASLIRKKGQSTLEYAVVLAVVIAALSYFGWGWFRGAYQRKLMDASDEISGGGQFDLEHSTIDVSFNRTVRSTEKLQGTESGATFTTTTHQDNQTTTTDVVTPDLKTRRGEE